MMANRRSLTAGAALALVLGVGACSTPSSSPRPAPTSSRSVAGFSPTPATSSPAPATPGHTQAKPSAKPHATEFNPPGDIPDNQVFVDFGVPGSRVHIKVPEGWARSSKGGTTTFSDHYNSIAIEVQASPRPPTVPSTRSTVVARLRRTVPKFASPKVTTVKRAHGSPVLLTYLRDSEANSVTGKVVRDAAERYEFWHHGQEADLTLTGPQGADNVDPWRLVSDSLHWR